jgi:hypothetical protein
MHYCRTLQSLFIQHSSKLGQELLAWLLDFSTLQCDLSRIKLPLLHPHVHFTNHSGSCGQGLGFNTLSRSYIVLTLCSMCFNYIKWYLDVWAQHPYYKSHSKIRIPIRIEIISYVQFISRTYMHIYI